MTESTWDRVNPFVLRITVAESDTDRLGHTNNTAYLRWMEEASWAHIEPLGMSWSVHEQTGKAMAILRTEIDYLGSSHVGDVLLVATWITASDGRLTSRRAFQIVHEGSGRTLARAECRYACIDLSSGRASRMPEAFAEAHRRALAAWNPASSD